MCAYCVCAQCKPAVWLSESGRGIPETYLADARAKTGTGESQSINAKCAVVGDVPAGSTVLGAEPGLSQSMAEASSDGLAGLSAILSGALPPDT